MVWFIIGGFLGGVSITLGLSLMILRSMLEYNEAEPGERILVREPKIKA
jgi:hypothetical protein